MNRPILVDAAGKVRDKRARRWGRRRGWTVMKWRGCGHRPYHLEGAPHVPVGRAMSIDELEEVLGID